MSSLAVVIDKSALLSSDFGLGMAQRYVPQAVIDAMPKFVRGKRVGKPKGVIVWRYVKRGGWRYSDGFRGGYVERRVGQNVEVAIHHDDYIKGKGALVWSQQTQANLDRQT